MSDLNERRRLREGRQLALSAELLAGRAEIDALLVQRASLPMGEIDRLIRLVRTQIDQMSACYGVRLTPARAAESNESELDFLMSELGALEEMILSLPS